MKPKWEDKIIDGGRKMIRLPFCYKKITSNTDVIKSKIGKSVFFRLCEIKDKTNDKNSRKINCNGKFKMSKCDSKKNNAMEKVFFFANILIKKETERARAEIRLSTNKDGENLQCRPRM
jgi:hypothetical protein